MSSSESFAASSRRTHKLAVAGMLSAIAFVLMLFETPVPFLIPPFIKLDISDLPELLAAFALGPVWGVVVTLLKNILFCIIRGTHSAYVGELCNFLLGGVFSFTAGLVYHRSKSRKSALIGAVAGAALMALISVPINYFLVYPAYIAAGWPLDIILGMYQKINPSAGDLLTCLLLFNLPFTFGKGLLDVALCFLIYKPLSPILHK